MAPAAMTHVGAYVAILCGVPLVLLGLRGLREAWATKPWPSVDGRILAARATLNSSSEISDGYSPELSYEYVVNGSVHRGIRLMAGVRTFHSSYPTPADALGEYRAGAACRVYYDPSDPDRSVLRQGATLMHYATPALGAMLVVAGVGGLFWP